MKRSRRISRSGNRGSASAIAILAGLIKVFLPVLVIAIAAYLFINYEPSATGSLRVTSSIPGADILVGGIQTGFTTDTVVPVAAGRSIITVRKAGLISDPEFIVVELKTDETRSVNFVLHRPETQEPQDTIPPLRDVRQEVFSTGEPVRSIPPGVLRSERRLVDFSQPEVRREHQQREAVNRSAESPVRNLQASESEVNEVMSLQGTQVTVTSSPSGAEIWVNGAVTPRQTPYTFRGLDRGLYSFRVRRDGYSTAPESTVVALSDEYQNELVAFNLTPNQALPRPTLTISTKPIAAGIQMDGKSVGLGQVTLDAEYGIHRISFAEVAGYRTPAVMTTILSEDQPSAVIAGEYERLVGDAYVAIYPSEDLQKFDPTRLRIYVDNELLLDGAQQAFDAALLGHLLSGKRLVRVHYGDLSDDIHINAVDGQVAEITFRVESFFSKRKLRLRDKTAVPVEQWQEKSKRLEVLTVS